MRAVYVQPFCALEKPASFTTDTPLAAKYDVTLVFAAGRNGVTRPIRCTTSACKASDTASDAR